MPQNLSQKCGPASSCRTFLYLARSAIKHHSSFSEKRFRVSQPFLHKDESEACAADSHIGARRDRRHHRRTRRGGTRLRRPGGAETQGHLADSERHVSARAARKVSLPDLPPSQIADATHLPTAAWLPDLPPRRSTAERLCQVSRAGKPPEDPRCPHRHRRSGKTRARSDGRLPTRASRRAPLHGLPRATRDNGTSGLRGDLPGLPCGAPRGRPQLRDVSPDREHRPDPRDAGQRARRVRCLSPHGRHCPVVAHPVVLPCVPRPCRRSQPRP